MEKPGGVWKSHLALGCIQIVFSSGHVVMKSCLDEGVNVLVFCTLRCVVSFLVLAVAGLAVERNVRKPRMSGPICAWLVLIGTTGVFGTILFLVLGLELTSPVYGAASQPLIPLFTFFMALIIRSETLAFSRLEGKVKLGGIFICMAGAGIVTFYKGPSILGTLLNSSSSGDVGHMLFGINFASFHLGMLCFLLSTFSMALYITLQAPLVRIYPATIQITAWAYLFGSILFGITAWMMASPSDWLLTTKQFLAVAYLGMFVSALTYGVITMCTANVGPTMVALYIPFQLVASPVLAYLFLGSPLYLGCLIGGFVIALGFYCVVWGRQRSNNLIASTRLPEQKRPLLFDERRRGAAQEEENVII